ncbi:MAG TPA: hypothetical protein VHL98_12990 [Microvirga sp.]|nr:hypothetical protein [Microvirga sp.]
MNILDEVRQALRPMIDQGLVQTVQQGPFATYDGGLTPTHGSVKVLVNADDPEAHRVDIMKLLLQAGLKVELSLGTNPLRPRG